MFMRIMSAASGLRKEKFFATMKRASDEILLAICTSAAGRAAIVNLYDFALVLTLMFLEPEYSALICETSGVCALSRFILPLELLEITFSVCS